MKNFDISNCELVKSDGVFTLKNIYALLRFGELKIANG